MTKPIVMRLDNNGNITWQKEYNYNFDYVSGFTNILFKDNSLYVGGSASYNNFAGYGTFLLKIDYSGGQTIWTKKYSTLTGNIQLQELIAVDSTLLVNITSSTGLTNTPTQTDKAGFCL